MRKRMLSILTALALCISLLPPVSLAAEAEDTGLCPHHTEHTENCGYIAPTEGQPCTHVHTAECYAPMSNGDEVYDVPADAEGEQFLKLRNVVLFISQQLVKSNDKSCFDVFLAQVRGSATPVCE